MLHIAGLHSRLECLRVIHTRLSQQESSREKLAQMDDKNPYLNPDKVCHSWNTCIKTSYYLNGISGVIFCTVCCYSRSSLYSFKTWC